MLIFGRLFIYLFKIKISGLVGSPAPKSPIHLVLILMSPNYHEKKKRKKKEKS